MLRTGNIYFKRFPDKPLALMLCSFSLILLYFSGIPITSIPSLLLNSSYLIFFTLGISIILSVGEIDLSVYGIAALSAVLTLWLISLLPTAHYLLLLLLPLIISIGLSLLNAFLIVRFARDSLLVTIATFSTFYGLSMYIFVNTFSKDSRLYAVPNILKGLLTYTFINIQVEVFIIIIFLILLWVTLNKTKIGLLMKAIGQNEQSATFSVIRIKRVKYISFLIAGLLYGVGTLINISRFSSTRPSELLGDVVIPIMCAILSGADIKGGQLPIAFIIVGVTTFLSLQQFVFSIRTFPPEAYHAVFGSVLIIYIIFKYVKGR